MKWTRPLPTDGTRFLQTQDTLVEVRESGSGFTVVNYREFCPSAAALDALLADKLGDDLPQLADE